MYCLDFLVLVHTEPSRLCEGQWPQRQFQGLRDVGVTKTQPIHLDFFKSLSPILNRVLLRKLAISVLLG